MSRPNLALDRAPLIGLVEKAARALEADMVREARERGYTEVRLAHNAVFGVLGTQAERTSDLAARAGITKQSMGEVVRELVELGICRMEPDPNDRRAKLVSFTDHGLEVAAQGRKHLRDLERRYARTFGDDYETARRVLEWVAEEFPRG